MLKKKIIDYGGDWLKTHIVDMFKLGEKVYVEERGFCSHWERTYEAAETQNGERYWKLVDEW